MSASELLKTASAAANTVVTNTESGRAFRRVVRDFVDALARVPGIPATEFSPLELEQLSSKAEHVISAIERHMDEDADKEAIEPREPGHDRGTVALLELVKPRTVDNPRDNLTYVVRLSWIRVDDPVNLLGIIGRWFGRNHVR